MEVINQRCIRDFKIDFDLIRYHNLNEKNIAEEKFLRKFDVLVNSTGVGTLGRVAQYLGDSTLRTVDSHVTIVRPIKSINPIYFGYAVKNKQSYIEALGEGSTGQTELSRTRLGNEIVINLPSLEEQELISKALLSLDEKIDVNNAMIFNIEKQAQALFKSWFIDFEPFQDGEFIDSELGKIPEGWGIVDLGRIVKLNTKSFKPEKSEDQYVLHFSIPAYDEMKFPVHDAVDSIKSNKYFVDEYSILVSKLNPKTPRVWLPNYDKSEANVCSTEFLVLDSEDEKNRSFVYELCKSAGFLSYIQSNATGSTNSRQRVRPKVALAYKLPYNKTVVDQFGLLVKPMHKSILNYRKQNQTLAQIRDILLPKLMSGEIKLSQDDLEETEVIL